MQRLLSLLAAVLLLEQASAQLLSPEQFLHYPLGSRYTAYRDIIDYVRQVAVQAPDRVQYIQYGTSAEGRPLAALAVTSPANRKNLERIRLENLRRAHALPDSAFSGTAFSGSSSPAESSSGSPAILWLSYNVHGNEPSSSEAAMEVLYALAKPSAQTARWLENTVVILDPCLNPDGRERYVNWYNSVAGSTPDPDMYTREHAEPWPGGRSNHYYYDLNRDWAWQTQVETRQRIQLYSKWLPQVHVDFHEQGVNEPYYFAPAAQPYHEVITSWQREFQDAVGKNNARYFDEKGWLYFTRDVFDLYYPSYGDTYPLYNGAVGMTYEQGGGPRGGLAALTEEGDTLTLKERILHHYTSSLSTLETTSLQADRLVKEFGNYFNNALINGAEGYKTFVIKYAASRQDQIAALLQLLDKNRIRYGKGKGSARGFNYGNGREETFTLDEKDIVVSTFQPQGALVKVLFEPQSKLADSLTYDITAWAMPYVYGLKAYAVKERIRSVPREPEQPVKNVPDESAYGYVIKWQSIKSAGVLAALLKQGIKPRVAEEPFELNGARFERGSLLLLKTGNRPFGGTLWEKLAGICNEWGVQMYAVKTGLVEKGNDFGSRRVAPVKAPVVAVLAGRDVSAGSLGEVWHFFEQELKYPVHIVLADDLEKMDWNRVNTLVLPDGDHTFLKNREIVSRLEAWIDNGGKLIAMEGAVEGLAKLNWGLRKKGGEEDKEEEEEGRNTAPYDLLKKYSNRDREQLETTTPGSIYKIEMDSTHPLAYGYPDHYYTLKLDQNIYEFLDGNGWNVGVLKENNQVAGYVGPVLKDKLKDGLLFGVLNKGKGSVVVLGEDPLFRSFWENGKLLFANAVFFTNK